MINFKNRYGEPISAEKANMLYKNFIKIKRRSIKKINTALENDDEAIRYHCGAKSTADVSSFLDVGFVFDQELIKEMACKIKGDGGFIIFFAARDEEDKPPLNEKENTNPNINKDGRPTLMIFPFEYADKEKNKLMIKTEDGSQHPGTGGPVKPPPPLTPTLEKPDSISADIPSQLPTEYFADEIATLK